MTNMKRIAVLALLLLGLASPAPTASETRQGIIIDGADSTLDTGLTDPAIALPVAPRIVFEYANSSAMHYLLLMPEELRQRIEEVTPRIIVEHANSTAHRDLVEVPPELQALIDAVKARLIIAYANSTHTFELGYPCSILDDGAPPVISEVHATDITANAATIEWVTNEEATSEVECGLVPDDPDRSDWDYVTEHALELTGLSADRTYSCRVGGSDKCGNHSESDQYSFTTLKPVYLPVILRNR